MQTKEKAKKFSGVTLEGEELEFLEKYVSNLIKAEIESEFTPSR